MAQPQRKTYTLQQKVDIIKESENGISRKELAAKYESSIESIRTILKNKKKIEEHFQVGNPRMKRVKTGKNKELEKAVYEWFKIQRNNHIPLSGSVIKSKALSFAESLGIVDFAASNGWLDRFKNRFGLHLSKSLAPQSEAAKSKLGVEFSPACQSEADSWLLELWPVIRTEFTDENIYNLDEAALFYRMLPECLSHAEAFEQDRSKITLILCANMTGNDKRKLFVIGNAEKPTSFPKDRQTLPFQYASQSNALMDKTIWTNYLRDWDKELETAKRKILLLADRCPSHCPVPNLKNITLTFFPPSVTSLLQPSDQGFIKTFKSYYRRHLIEKLISELESRGLLPKLSAFHCIVLASTAWSSVTSAAIANSFAQLSPEESYMNDWERIFQSQNECLLDQLYEKLPYSASDGRETFDHYLGVDKEEPTCEPISDEQTPPIPAASETTNILEKASAADSVHDLGENTLHQNGTNIHHHIEGVRNWILDNGLYEMLNPHLSYIEKIILETNISKRLQA